MSKLFHASGGRRGEVLFVVIILLVSTISFAFGYLVAERSGRAPIIIEQCRTAQGL